MSAGKWREPDKMAEGLLGVNVQLEASQKFMKEQQAAAMGIPYISPDAITAAQKQRAELEKINAELSKLAALSQIEMATHDPMTFDQSEAPGGPLAGFPGLEIPTNQLEGLMMERVKIYAKYLQELTGVRDRQLPQPELGETGRYEADLGHLGIPSAETMQGAVDAADQVLEDWVNRVIGKAQRLQQTLGMVQGVFMTAFQGIKAGISAGGAQAIAAFVSMAGQILAQIGGYMVSLGSAEIAIGTAPLKPDPAMATHGAALVAAGSALSIAGTVASIVGAGIGTFAGGGQQTAGFGSQGFEGFTQIGNNEFELGPGDVLTQLSGAVSGLNQEVGRLAAAPAKSVLMTAARQNPRFIPIQGSGEAPA